MSLTMLANLLIEFDAVEAINLDGGGSTTMVIRNKLVNRPSDATGERSVSDAILILRSITLKIEVPLNLVTAASELCYFPVVCWSSY